MKIRIFYTIAVFLLTQLGRAQVLFTENFDNLTVGNLGTDPDGYVPGQGGWLTKCWYTKGNSFFNVVNESTRGKVLDLTSAYTKTTQVYTVVKPNLNALIDMRTAGNDVIKFEIDYFTGNKFPSSGSNLSKIAFFWEGIDYYGPQTYLFQLAFNKDSGIIQAQSATYSTNPNSIIQEGSAHTYLPFNTWVTFLVYLDYPNDKIYIEIPYLNKAYMGALIGNNANRTSNNLMQDFKPATLIFITNFGSYTQNIYSSQRYDNIKITALNSVPPAVINLSTNEQLAAKFKMYPNPATTVVNITNSENMLVNKVTVYDISGKELNTQSFNNETQIQLNVENLANGTYMLHLQTNEGTAVKKLVKK